MIMLRNARSRKPRAGVGRRIPDGNPPSGVASGYVWFDVMALLVAPMIYARFRSLSYTTTEGAL
jgi:hypothetical protein